MHRERDDTRTLRGVHVGVVPAHSVSIRLRVMLLTLLCSLPGHFLVLVAVEHGQGIDKQLGSCRLEV